MFRLVRGTSSEYWPAAAASNLAAGDIQLFGANILGVTNKPVVEGELVDFAVRGIFEVTKNTGFTRNPGQAAFFDTAAGHLVASSNTNTVNCGVVIKTAASGDTTALVSIFPALAT